MTLVSCMASCLVMVVCRGVNLGYGLVVVGEGIGEGYGGVCGVRCFGLWGVVVGSGWEFSRCQVGVWVRELLFAVKGMAVMGCWEGLGFVWGMVQVGCAVDLLPGVSKEPGGNLGSSSMELWLDMSGSRGSGAANLG